MKARDNQSSTLVIEVTRVHLLAIVLRPQKGELIQVRARIVPWKKDSTGLATEGGAHEFASALKSLIQEEKLTGFRTVLCLNEDYCVTRVATGPTDRVRKELSQLEERSSLYLSLGAGQKAHARSIRQLDARHQHALLSVANQKVLETVSRIAKDLGLVVETIEPALVALSRCVGHMRRDAEVPAIVVNLGENGFELGLSHRGQLLLDYRPGGKMMVETVAELLTKHLPRLDRYCQRYFHIPSNSLHTVLLCGSAERVEAVGAGFAGNDQLRVEELRADAVEPTWQFPPEIDSRACAALGSQLAAQGLVSHVLTPNFMERIKAERRAPVWPALWRTAWPVAAAALVSVCLLGLATQQKWKVAALSRTVKELETTTQRIAELKAKMGAADAKIKHLTAIDKRLTQPAWNELIVALGHCLPDDVWLENIVSQENGKLVLAGASYGEGGIYEFIRYLQQVPLLKQVALEQTQPTSLANGPATRFDLNCDFAGHADRAKDGEKR